MLRTLLTLVWLCLAGLVATNAAAQPVCTPLPPGCPMTVSPSDSFTIASACLCESTQFYDDVRTRIATETFDQILPPSYETPGLYSETLLDEVLAWGLDGTRTAEKDEIVFFASLRKASAHGMLGDHRLVRGLNASFDPLLADPIREGLEQLDSRSCAASPETVCTVDGDCGAGDSCVAARVAPGTPTGNEPFGAVQEYRRGEQALTVALERLGVTDFESLDASGGDCGSVGCATRLLLRLGAMKARAQEVRPDRSRDCAAARPPTSAPWRCARA